MEVKKYRKKPVVIEAIQLLPETIDEIDLWADTLYKGNFPGCGFGIDPVDGLFKITTLEGVMIAEVGDWIIKGVKGEFYPCKTDIFEATYDTVLDGNTACENVSNENTDSQRHPKFMKELTHAINRGCLENDSNTPDFILADFVSDCLAAFAKAVNQRKKWWGQPDEWDKYFTGTGSEVGSHLPPTD